jgi:hypothetical protein
MAGCAPKVFDNPDSVKGRNGGRGEGNRGIHGTHGKWVGKKREKAILMDREI